MIKKAFKIGLYHPLNGDTNLKYKLLCFLILNKKISKRKALAFYRDRCCHLVLCLRMILFHCDTIGHWGQNHNFSRLLLIFILEKAVAFVSVSHSHPSVSFASKTEAMDKLKLTRLNLGRVCNYRCGRASTQISTRTSSKQPNLLLKTWPKKF